MVFAVQVDLFMKNKNILFIATSNCFAPIVLVATVVSLEHIPSVMSFEALSSPPSEPAKYKALFLFCINKNSSPTPSPQNFLLKPKRLWVIYTLRLEENVVREGIRTELLGNKFFFDSFECLMLQTACMLKIWPSNTVWIWLLMNLFFGKLCALLTGKTVILRTMIWCWFDRFL